MKTVAVIFGGQSTEHDVSIVTALASVIKPLELTGEFEIVPVYIAKNGSWYWDEKLKNIGLFQTDEIDQFLQKAPKTHILFDDGLTLVKSSQFAGRKQYKKIDIVFPAMHGTHGEDGELMGILEMAGVPYVGCGVTASAIAMDKVFSKLITQNFGIPSTPWVALDSLELRDPSKVVKKCNELAYPLFVKPVRLGSSIGITRVSQESELLNALEVAGHYDDKIIVEQGVSNLVEVTLPIMGNENPVPALLEQPLLSSEDFFDFDAKYMNGGKKGGKKSNNNYSNLPADLPEGLYKKAEKLGLDVYRAIGCEGIARVDMLIDQKTEAVYFNEVNPLPGDLYAHNWRAAGVSNTDLVQKLVSYAQDRFTQKQKHKTSFDTNYLRQF